MRIPVTLFITFLAAALAAAPALADKDSGGGKGKDKHGDKWEQKDDKHGKKDDHKHDKQADKQADKHREARQGAYFDDHDREHVHGYYTSYQGKKCPPGLAKKNNGCMPPGQAKKWHVGERLPSTAVIYTVPQPILVQLPPPPPQHKYVRVAGDILLITIGTQMVIDGISGLAN